MRPCRVMGAVALELTHFSMSFVPSRPLNCRSSCVVAFPPPSRCGSRASARFAQRVFCGFADRSAVAQTNFQLSILTAHVHRLAHCADLPVQHVACCCCHHRDRVHELWSQLESSCPCRRCVSPGLSLVGRGSTGSNVHLQIVDIPAGRFCAKPRSLQCILCAVSFTCRSQWYLRGVPPVKHHFHPCARLRKNTSRWRLGWPSQLSPAPD